MEHTAPVYRIYRLGRWQRTFALVFLAFGVFFAFGSWKGPLLGQSDPEPFLMLLGLIFPLTGIGLTMNAFQTTVTFSADAIELHSILGHRRLPLDGIRGRREHVAGSGEEGGTKYLMLVPYDDRLPTLKFMKGYTFDDTFFLWFYELPDLDAEDKKVHKDSNFGLV
jgi:hypothetical protein